MSLSPDERRQRMDALRRNFLDQLPSLAREALAAFESAWTVAGGEEPVREALGRLHTLAGTLGTFGFLRLFEAIRSLEYLLLNPPRPLPPATEEERAKGLQIAASIRDQVAELVVGPASTSNSTGK